MKTGLLLFFAGALLTGRAQDLRQELTAMNGRLEQLTDYRITVDYTAGDTSDLSDSGTASVLVSPGGYFYNTEFASMIVNEKHTLIVNEEERTLIWSENRKANKKKPSATGTVLQGIDTLIASADSVYFTVNGTDRIYHLRFHGSYFDLVELTFRENFLSHVLYFYNPEVSGGPGVTASCNVQIDEHPVYDKQLLETDFYLTQQDGATLPTAPFTGYVLIHNPSFESTFE
jgi:hypothetical protein